MPRLRPQVASNPQDTIGRYTLHTQIGVGGMASVFLGWANGPGDFSRIAAIKRMHAQFANDQEFVARFRDEAWLSARLLHPNIVQVVDVVDTHDALLMVMEYVHGVSLRSLWSDARIRGSALPLGMIAGILVPALHGLHAAHEATDDHGQPIGIVHRDFSPQNIMVGTDGHTRILDFGIAKARTHLHVTTTGCLSGKIGYLAPEQIHGNQLDRRTDVFAAGIVLWEMLTGRRLFSEPGLSEAAAVHRLLKQPIPSPETFNANVPKRLSEIVLRALDRCPDSRFDSARDLALQIEGSVEVASPSRVADWLGHLCAPRVAELSRMLNEVRRSMATAGSVPAGAANPAFPTVTPFAPPELEAVTVDAKIARRKPATWKWIGVAVLCATLGAGASQWARLRGVWTTPRPAAVSAPMPAVQATSPASPGETAATKMKIAMPAIEPLPASAVEPAPAKVELVVTKTRAVAPATVQRRHITRRAVRAPAHPTTAARKAEPPVVRSAGRPNCDPPTYIDADGVRVFKDECL